MSHFIAGIIGTTGYGKTVLVREITRQFRRVIFLDVLDEYDNAVPVLSVPDFVEYIPLDDGGDLRLAVRLEKTEDYQYIFRALKYFRDIVLVVEEANIFSSPYITDDGLRELIFRGRRRGINIIWTSQRPASVGRDLTSQSTVLVAFRLLEPRDLDYLPREWRSPERARELTELPRFHFRVLRGGPEFQNFFLDKKAHIRYNMEKVKPKWQNQKKE